MQWAKICSVLFLDIWAELQVLCSTVFCTQFVWIQWCYVSRTLVSEHEEWTKTSINLPMVSVKICNIFLRFLANFVLHYQFITVQTEWRLFKKITDCCFTCCSTCKMLISYKLSKDAYCVSVKLNVTVVSSVETYASYRIIVSCSLGVSYIGLNTCAPF